MRIALLHLFAWPQVRRGGERYVHELAAWLADRGHEVDLLIGSADEIRHHDGVRSTALAPFDAQASPDRLRHTAAAAVRLLAARPDVVHALVPNLALSGPLVGVPTVWTLLGYVPPVTDRSWAWRQAAQRADVVATLNGAIGADLGQAAGRHAEVLTPGIDLEAFPPRPAPASGPPRLLFSGHVGRQAAYKGLDRLLAALPHVLAEHPDARLRLSGPGDPAWALADAPRASRDAVDVLGAGDLGSVARSYRDATVTVSAAHDEAFGLSVLESLASGTPVVAARRGGPAELLTVATGAFADPGDPRDLAAAALRAIALAGNEATAAACRDRARGWSWEAVGPRHVDVYARLAGSGGRPRQQRPHPRAATGTDRAPEHDAPTVSVIVPVRDRAELLTACLDGLARQTATGFEVVVVDDGSTDGSGAAAQGFADRLDVRVLRTAGVGAVEARRLGVAAARAPYLAFTDSDCIPDPEWVAAGLRALEEEGADLVQGRTRAAGPRSPLQRSVAARPDDGLYATCNVFYRRSAYERAGGFDGAAGRRLGFRPGRTQRDLGMGEDTLLGWRVRRAGRAVHTEDAVVRHHVFPPDIGDDIRRWWMAGGFAALVRDVPELRSHLLRLGVLLPGSLRPLLLIAALLAVAGRRRASTAAALVWVLGHGRRAGWRPRWWAHALLGDLVIETALVAGSVRERSVVL